MTNALPDVLDRTIDADAHEMAPLQAWGPMFGEAAGRIAELMVPFMKKAGANDFYNPDLEGDVEEITEEHVWHIRGTRAPSAFDFSRRLEVLDVMGIDKQLVFPSYGLMASAFMVGNEHTLRQLFELTLPEPELRALGRAGMAEYNEW